MIYHLSLTNGPLWYQDGSLFTDQNRHQRNLEKLITEYGYSQEIFIKDHKRNHPNDDPEAWKIMEIASMGTLSKFYKNLNHQLPDKAIIAKGMGLNLHSELSSWLEAIVYVRNIIAHHSRLWCRNMVKKPKVDINNPKAWINDTLTPIQKKRVYPIISAMVYVCNIVTPNHNIKNKIKDLFTNNSDLPLHKIGFINDWDKEPLWS